MNIKNKNQCLELITESLNLPEIEESKCRSPSSSQRIIDVPIQDNISRFRNIIEDISDAGSEESKQVVLGTNFNNVDPSMSESE